MDGASRAHHPRPDAPMTIAVDGEDDVRTVMTIERDAELTG
jgi:hypothetical protein